MSNAYNVDPGGGTSFRKSNLTPRSPPPTNKRLFNEVSPSCTSPTERPKRIPPSQPIDVPLSPVNSCDSTQSYCDLVAQASNYLSKINELVNDQGSRINIANKTSIMDLTQRVTGIVSLLAIKSSCNETKLLNAEKDLDQFKKTAIHTQPNPVPNTSYANSVKLRLPKVVPAVDSRPPVPCIVAYPTEERSTEYGSSSATKQALMKAIKPSDDGFQIVGVKKTAKSGVVLRVSNIKQLEKLQSVEAIKQAGLRLEKPKGRKPRIIIKDIPSSMEDDAFLTALYRQNILDELSIKEDDFIKSTRIVRRRNVNNGRKWLGLELEAEVRNHLISSKEKLFIGWARCRFDDDVEVVKCSNCQKFGHVHKYCTNKTPTCGICALNHQSLSCPHKDDPKFIPTCAACKYYNKQADHRCGSQECLTYKSRLEQLILNTNY